METLSSLCCLPHSTHSVRSNKAIEGIRTVLIIIVLIHHIDILNPELLSENVLWSNHGNLDGSDIAEDAAKHLESVAHADQNGFFPQRRLLKFAPLPKTKTVNIWHTHSKLSALGLFIFVFNGYLSVTIFFILSGYILSFQCFKTYAQCIQDQNMLFPKWLYDLIKLSIKRSLRFIIPLLVVQIGTFLLWYFDLIIFTDHKRWILVYRHFRSFYDHNLLSFDFIFMKGGNGALWVMKDLFLAPLLVITIILSVITFRTFRSRFCVYCVYGMIYFFEESFGIILGIIIADILYLDNYNNKSKILRFYFRYKWIIPSVSFSCLFLKKMVYPNWRYLPDFNLSTGFRSIIWFNIGLLILGYPQNIFLRMFEWKYLSSFGKYTFSLYITHIPVYRMISYCIVAKYNLFTIIGDKYYIFIYLFGMVMALIFSVIFYIVIEQPSRRYFVNPIMQWFQQQQSVRLTANNQGDSIDIKTM